MTTARSLVGAIARALVGAGAGALVGAAVAVEGGVWMPGSVVAGSCFGMALALMGAPAKGKGGGAR